MRSLIISLPTTSPLLFPIHSHPIIHKNQPILHVFSYIRSLFIGIDVPLPPIKQAVFTTHKHQHKLHLSYTHSDRYLLQRTQQLCTQVGLLCNILDFNKPVTSTNTSTSTLTSTSQKHVIDLELLPDEWEDEFFQPQPVGAQSPPHPTLSSSLSSQHKTKQTNKKHVKINTSHNITYHIPSTTTHKHNHKHIQAKNPAPSSSSLHYYTATPTITFAEWEKIPIHLHNLPYTFCIQCEKPIKHQYWYDHHIQAHVQKQSTTTATTTPTTPITDSTPTTTPTSSSTTITTTTPTSLSTTTTTTATTTKPSKPSKLTYTCPYAGCEHKFNPNTSHFVRDLNAHIDSYHDDTFLYSY